jgi:hypothetical protein
MKLLTDTDVLELWDMESSDTTVRWHYENTRKHYDKLLNHYQNAETPFEDRFRRSEEEIFKDTIRILRDKIKRYFQSKPAPLSTWKLAQARREAYPESKGNGERLSRSASWRFHLARARESIEALQVRQESYADWRDNLPETLQDTATAEKLDAVADIDFDAALEVIEEAEQLDLPQGFGRD